MNESEIIRLVKKHAQQQNVEIENDGLLFWLSGDYTELTNNTNHVEHDVCVAGSGTAQGIESDNSSTNTTDTSTQDPKADGEIIKHKPVVNDLTEIERTGMKMKPKDSLWTLYESLGDDTGKKYVQQMIDEAKRERAKNPNAITKIDRLIFTLQAASDVFAYYGLQKVKINSSLRYVKGSGSGTSNHLEGWAVDLVIRDQRSTSQFFAQVVDDVQAGKYGQWYNQFIWETNVDKGSAMPQREGIVHLDFSPQGNKYCCCASVVGGNPTTGRTSKKVTSGQQVLEWATANKVRR